MEARVRRTAVRLLGDRLAAVAELEDGEDDHRDDDDADGFIDGSLSVRAIQGWVAETGVVVATPYGRGVGLAKTVIDGTGNADVAIAGIAVRGHVPIVVGGTGLAGCRLTDRLPYFTSGVAYPDCTIFDAGEAANIGARQAAIIGAGFFGGEGFILQRLRGDGLAFLAASGTTSAPEQAAQRAAPGRARTSPEAR